MVLISVKNMDTLSELCPLCQKLLTSKEFQKHILKTTHLISSGLHLHTLESNLLLKTSFTHIQTTQQTRSDMYPAMQNINSVQTE